MSILTESALHHLLDDIEAKVKIGAARAAIMASHEAQAQEIQRLKSLLKLIERELERLEIAADEENY
jgi:hypothetical protein